jgi:hypothetical protein
VDNNLLSDPRFGYAILRARADPVWYVPVRYGDALLFIAAPFIYPPRTLRCAGLSFSSSGYSVKVSAEAEASRSLVYFMPGPFLPSRPAGLGFVLAPNVMVTQKTPRNIVSCAEFLANSQGLGDWSRVRAGRVASTPGLVWG